MNKPIISEKAPKAVGPYVHAIQYDNTLFCSGQLGLNPETGELEAGIEAQTVTSLNNLNAVLEEGGFSIVDVVKTTIFLADMDDFGTVNGIYENFFGNHKPARSCVQVAKLPKGGLVEIECIACK